MTPLNIIEERIAELADSPDASAAVGVLLNLGEETLEHWVSARGNVPTMAKKEGFRLLALHRQGAKDVPSFNACRETCRELAYHYNLITMAPDHPDTEQRLRLASLVANHLYLFVRGKMEESELGDFCCSSKPIRSKPVQETTNEHRGI
jgi:hypothetical protein